MLGQAHLATERPSLRLQVETDQTAFSQDVASRRRTRFLWTGIGFVIFMLIGVSACGAVPLASHVHAKAVNLDHSVAFIPAVPVLSRAGNPESVHTSPTGLLPADPAAVKRQHPLAALRMSGKAGVSRTWSSRQAARVDARMQAPASRKVSVRYISEDEMEALAYNASLQMGFEPSQAMMLAACTRNIYAIGTGYHPTTVALIEEVCKEQAKEGAAWAVLMLEVLAGRMPRLRSEKTAAARSAAAARKRKTHWPHTTKAERMVLR
jgi:hypothetical protein